MNQKTKKNTEQYAPVCSILPICILVSILTAVLVTLIFSVAFVRSFKFETKTPYNVEGAFKSAVNDDQKDDDDIVLINGEAVADFFASGNTGFIYATDDGCIGCEEFGELLAEQIEHYEVANIYHYQYNASSSSEIESSAHKMTVGQEEEPVLLYIQDGRIHDRLDNPKDKSNLSIFLAKYK